MSRLLTLSGGSSGSTLGPQWPAVARQGLGPLPPGPYDQAIPPTLPVGRSLRYYRGNFCGIRIPNAPVVPGCNPANPELVMACLLDNYPRAVQEAFLTQYAEDGFTHLQRSVGHALGYGKTLDQYSALSARARGTYGLFCDHWLIANELPGFQANADAAYWDPILTPIIARLAGDGILDRCCVGWQLDQWNIPGNVLIGIIALVAKRVPQNVPLDTHWMNEALAWWKTGGEVWTDEYQTINVVDRFTWWQAMSWYLTGGHHQGNTTLARTDWPQYQGRLRDTLNNFHNGRMGQSRRGGVEQPFTLDVFECTAQDQFDGSCSELEGDRVGLVLSCTKADGVDAWMDGYGNGARRVDGTAL